VAKELVEDGYNVEVIDMFTIKPLDINMILERTKDKEKVFTIENHSINNGLGSSVAEVIAENNIPVKLHRIGVNERFGQVGTPDFLQREFGLDSESIKQNILNHL
jgi:transketolase